MNGECTVVIGGSSRQPAKVVNGLAQATGPAVIERIYCNEPGIPCCEPSSDAAPTYLCPTHRAGRPLWYAQGDYVEVSYSDIAEGPTKFCAKIVDFGENPEPAPTPFAVVQPQFAAPEKAQLSVSFFYLRKLSVLEVLAWASV